MVEEKITDSQLIEVFDLIKGPFGKNRVFINIDDFKRAVIQYKPACLKDELEIRKVGGDGDGVSQFNHLLEDLFRNICESVSPVLDVDEMT